MRTHPLIVSVLTVLLVVVSAGWTCADTVPGVLRFIDGDVVFSCHNPSECDLGSACPGELVHVRLDPAGVAYVPDEVDWRVPELNLATGWQPAPASMDWTTSFSQPGVVHIHAFYRDPEVDAGSYDLEILEPMDARCQPGLARSCCCGLNSIDTFSGYPDINWAIDQSGHFLRIWWDKKDFLEVVPYPYLNQPLVSGSLHQDPFGDGAVALNQAGQIVHTVEDGGIWTSELVLPDVVEKLGGVRPCMLETTTRPDFAGIYAVLQDSIVRFYRVGTTWQYDSVSIGNNAANIAPGSLHEGVDGRLLGTLTNGQRWNVWFANGDPHDMHYDYSAGSNVAPSPAPRCAQPLLRPRR